jgi:hypothetical protein
MANVWTFDTTGDAYDSVQCDDDIKNGDILVIPSENVVGLAWTWPIAVTDNAGHLHSIDDKPDSLEVIMRDAKWSDEQVRAAIAKAEEMSLKLDAVFSNYREKFSK